MPPQVNLAPPEALQRVAALAEAPSASVTLAERGDAAPLPRHPGFRLLAAMNPATGPRIEKIQIPKDKRSFSIELTWKRFIEPFTMQAPGDASDSIRRASRCLVNVAALVF